MELSNRHPAVIAAAEARHIQAALNRGDAGISLEAGDFPIGQTLTVPFKVGGLMYGVSAGEYVRPRHPHRGSSTVLKFEWDQGAEGSSILIEILGAYFRSGIYQSTARITGSSRPSA